METAIEIITDTQIKRKIVGICDKAFMHGITIRKNYEEIFQKIDQNAVFIAAVIDKNYVGYAALYANNHESRIAYISMIGVVQDMQRMHIGSRLLKRCIEVSKKNGMNKIRLVVLHENEKGICFYKKNGFAFEKKCTEQSDYFIKVL